MWDHWLQILGLISWVPHLPAFSPLHTLLTFDSALFLSFYLLTLLLCSNLHFLFTAVRPGQSPEDPRWEQIWRGGQKAGGYGAGSQGEVVTKPLDWAVLAHKSLSLWCKKKQRQSEMMKCRTTSLAKRSQACPVETFIASHCFFPYLALLFSLISLL